MRLAGKQTKKEKRMTMQEITEQIQEKKKKEISTTPASKSLVLFNLLLSLLPILNKLINKSVH